MIPVYQSRSNIIQSMHTNLTESFPLHLHYYLEFLYIEKGDLELTHLDKIYHLHSGDLCIIFPHELHGYNLLENTPNPRCLITICRPDCAGIFKSVIFSNRATSPVIHDADKINNVEEFLKELSTLFSANRFIKQTVSEETQNLAKSLVQVILARCLPHMELHPSGSLSKDSILLQILDYLAHNYRSEQSIKGVAKILNVSPGYISRIFSEQIHISFSDYLHQLRLEYAKNLLETSDLSIMEIAMESGFGTLRSFNRVFKEYLHCTPVEYRKNLNT